MKSPSTANRKFPNVPVATLESFPDDFVWGVATAAYQVEGAVKEGGRGPSIWDTFSHTPGLSHNGDTGDIAADHYHRLESDLDLLSTLGIGAYRFSISWSRLQPDGQGSLNQEGVEQSDGRAYLDVERIVVRLNAGDWLEYEVGATTDLDRISIEMCEGVSSDVTITTSQRGFRLTAQRPIGLLRIHIMP